MSLFLEDLKTGMVFTSPTASLSAEDIKQFARQFDPQPFHLDEGAESLFGGLAASGWHTGAIAMRLLVGSVPLAGGIIGAAGEIEWRLPVRPGDVLQVSTEVLEVTPSRSRPERGMVVLRAETRNQAGEVVQVFTSRVIVPRRAF